MKVSACVFVVLLTGAAVSAQTSQGTFIGTFTMPPVTVQVPSVVSATSCPFIGRGEKWAANAANLGVAPFVTPGTRVSPYYTPPEGEVWHVYASGVWTNAPNAADFMMELLRPVAPFGPNDYWGIPVGRSHGTVNGTPALARETPIDLWPGDYLRARQNGVNTAQQINGADVYLGITYLYYRYSASCYQPR